jgi:nitric oxide dioxygenase
MLSEQSAATVRATLPVVGGAIGEITERFYARLFAARPELLRDLFNRGNQAAGTQRQAWRGRSPPSRRTWWTTPTSGRTRC